MLGLRLPLFCRDHLLFYSSPCQSSVLLRFLLSSVHFSLPVLTKTEHEESEQLSEVGEIQKCRRFDKSSLSDVVSESHYL